MDILQEAAERFLNGADSEHAKGLSLEAIMPVVQDLITDSDGKLDLEGLVSNLNGQGLMEIASSWLGNGENLPISKDGVRGLFGSDKLSQIASTLGLDEDSVAKGVTDMLPDIINKSSPNGALIDMAGDLLGSFKKFF